MSAIYLVVILFQTIRNNSSLQSQINQMNRDIAQLNSEKADLSYQIAYYQTDAFKEKAARAKLGLQQPGENLLILPKSSSGTPAPVQAVTKTAAPAKPESNFSQWWHFLFG